MTLTNGLIVMIPSSVSSTGSGNSSSINSDGSISFSSCETLSINDVFTTSYRNYMVSMRSVGQAGSTGQSINFKLRSSGTDNSSNYTFQVLQNSGTTGVAGSQNTLTYSYLFATNTTESGHLGYFYGPRLAQPTAFRTINYFGGNGTWDVAGTHGQSTGYDGFTIFPNQGSTGKISGLLTVFAFND